MTGAESLLQRTALTPAAERILKAHLVDVFDDDVESPTLRMALRSTDAANEGEEYSIPIPAGAFIVNATDHISTKTNHFAPILSDDGLVVCPQKLTGFTGPSANHVTHAYYTGTLAGNWERLPRVSFEPRDKARVGIVRPPSNTARPSFESAVPRRAAPCRAVPCRAVPCSV